MEVTTASEVAFPILGVRKPEVRRVSGALVFIVDEHESVRRALAERLGSSPGIRVLGHTGKVEEVLQATQIDRPDVVLVEVKRSDGLGLEVVRELSSRPKPPLVVVLTSYPTAWEEEAARRAGASAYLMKDIDSEDLLRHIDELLG